jgi:hypothetical protein
MLQENSSLFGRPVSVSHTHLGLTQTRIRSYYWKHSISSCWSYNYYNLYISFTNYSSILHYFIIFNYGRLLNINIQIFNSQYILLLHTPYLIFRSYSILPDWLALCPVTNYSFLSWSWSYCMTDGQSVSQSVSMSWCWVHSGTCDQILLPVWRLEPESYCLVSVGRSLWWEDGSADYSAITQWSESCRTHNHTLLSHLRLPQPGGSGSRIYIPRNRVAQLYPQALGSTTHF